MTFEQSALDELSASIKEHGILQPVLLRPFGGPGRYQLIAGERRWRAAKAAGLDSIPAMIEEIDDDTALEIAIIENLQREDLSPLEEATMYDRMVKEHGYSIRRLAQKLGKDKGYLENRLRLADAPEEVRELVSLRKDTLSHAYELMKVEDPKKRRRLAAQVASGELSLVKLKQKIEGRRTRVGDPLEEDDDETTAVPSTGTRAGSRSDDLADADSSAWSGGRPGGQSAGPLREDSLLDAKQGLAESLEELFGVLRQKDVLDSIGDVDRANLAKYLVIAKLRLENAIALVRSGDGS
jgi:ParB/RepB/Spo0J family partition protein